jgi:hypothetical protein
MTTEPEVGTASLTWSRGRKLIGFGLFAMVLLAALAFASAGRAAVESPPPPQIWSDKADYAPGEMVTLSGANWAVGESVHIRVNDDAGQTWSRDVDVTAADDGTISDQFQLPDSFVATYSVSAVGSTSGIATWSFTDGTIRFELATADNAAPAGFTWSVDWQVFNGTGSLPNGNCSLPVGSSGTANLTGNILSSGTNPGGNQTDSGKPTGVTVTGASFAGQYVFDYWSDSATSTTPSANLCKPGQSGGGNFTTLYAHFKPQLRFQLATAGNDANGVAGFTWSVNWQFRANTSCGGTPGTPGTASYTVNALTSGSQPTLSTTQGVMPTGSTATGSFTSYAFQYWSDTAASTTPLSGSALCKTWNGATGGAVTLFAHFSADSTPPTSTIQCNGAACSASFYGANVSVTLAATDNAGGSGVKEIRYTTDGSAPTASSTLYTGAFTVSATTTVKFRAEDNAGNVESPANSQDIKIDKVAPDTVLDTHPTDPTSSSSASFAFHATDASPSSGIAGFQCSLDGAAYAACNSGTASYGPLADGTHTFDVKASDNAGNEDGSPAHFSWLVDTVKPSSSASAPEFNNTATIHVTYSASDNTDGSGLDKVELWVKTPLAGSVYTKVDTDASPGAAGSFDYAVPTNGSGDLVDGTYRFYTIAVDKAGNREATPTTPDGATTQTVQDSIKPDLSASHTADGANGWNKTSPVNVTVNASDSGSGLDGAPTCTVDGGTATLSPAGSGSWTLSVSGEGTHLVSCSVSDKATNGQTASDTVKIDTVKPSIGLSHSANAAHWNNSSPVSVAIAASDATSDLAGAPTCTVDLLSAAVSGTASPYHVDASGQGTHAVHCSVTDNAGNSNSGDDEVKIDLSAPGAPSLTLSEAPDNAAQYVSGSTAYYRPGTAGASFKVDATASDADSGIKHVSFPSLSTGVTGGPTNDTTSPYEQTYSWTNLTTGDHPGSVTATNNADLTSLGASFSLTADSAAPTGGSVSYADGYNTTGSVAVATANGTDALSGVNAGSGVLERALADLTNNSCGSYGAWASVAATNTVPDGKCAQYRYRVSDNVGNEATYTSASVVKVDLTNPVITANVSGTAGDNGWYTSNVDVTWSVGDPQSGIASSSGCSGTTSITADTSPAGQLVGPCSATNNAGLSDSKSVTIKRDATQPTIGHSVSPSSPDGDFANGWYKTAPTVTFSCSDATPGSGVASCFANGGPSAAKTLGENASPQSVNGSARDNAGNTATDSVTGLKVDLSNPATPAFVGIAAQTYAVSDLPPQSSISCNSSDAISGLRTCVVTGYSSDYGSHTLTATATDNSGRTSTTTLTYIVGLKSGGILSPVTSNANPLSTTLSAFKIKSVIPIKFHLYMDAAMTQVMTSPPAGSIAKLWFGKYDSSTDTSDAVDFVSAGNANTDSIFRWTGSPDYQFIYNLATAGNAQGTYGVQLTLYASNGTTVLAQSLKQYFVLRN